MVSFSEEGDGGALQRRRSFKGVRAATEGNKRAYAAAMGYRYNRSPAKPSAAAARRPSPLPQPLIGPPSSLLARSLARRARCLSPHGSFSFTGNRILRRRCDDTCTLRSSIRWIDGADAQAHATAFAAKFFGRSALMSLLSSTPFRLRPAVFRSLLYEACGRSVNPMSGATGLLWTGSWHLCHAAVQTVLAGGTIEPMLELGGSAAADAKELLLMRCQNKRRRSSSEFSESGEERPPSNYCGLYPTECFALEDNRPASTLSADQSSSTTADAGSAGGEEAVEKKPTLLNLFV